MLVQDLITLGRLSVQEKAQIIMALSLANKTDVKLLKKGGKSETVQALLGIEEFKALKDSERLATELASHLHHTS
ncbi:hypothetical protein [Pseudoalteromonas luteoviolacea]|uniref:hypothetical protein n=1 Tax=Pseudoalteromonas luteoviolacea TaxID=43657 RepID=UPI001B38232A|nr:hypothetical protein [Pseudoalteromonas luteoviolacea]MBQ4839805.1 hypothetical protein [Pseudoalteromonas luteoviolacea]